MLWLLISIIGYFFNAASTLVDKFLLKKLIPRPAVYAFYVSLLSLFVFIFAPFNFQFPGFFTLLVVIAAGIAFTYALLFFYSALQKGEASRIDPFVGGLSPVFVFVLAWLVLNEVLSFIQILAFILIIAGGLILSVKIKGAGKSLTFELVLMSLGAAFLFALSHVLTKYVYVHHNFISGLVWRGIGSFAGGLTLLAVPVWRREIIVSFKSPQIKTGALFIAGQLAAALSFVLINYAFYLGSVALVNALTGLQYVFLFFMILPFTKKHPELFEEIVTPQIIRQKILSLLLISAGIFLLFL